MLDKLLQTPVPPTKLPRRGGWSYTTQYEPDGTATITATTTEQLKSDADIKQFIEANGGIIPDGYRAVLVEARHNTAAWHRDKVGADATTRGAWFYRFRIEPATAIIDLDAIIAEIKNKPPAPKTKTKTVNPYWYIIADVQLGKSDGDGVTGTLTTFYQSLDNAVERWRKLEQPPVQIAWLGDCIEGNVSGGGTRMGFRTTLTITEQNRILRRLMLDVIDRFIDAGATTIDVNVVNGNHDQAQRHPIDTDASDGWATECAIAVADAIKLNPKRYGKVTTYVPEKDADHIIREIAGTTVVMLHGHQLPKRNGGIEWLAGQSVNRTPAGSADILLHGHQHSFGIQSIRSATAICAPTFEERSVWFQQKHGSLSKRGGLSLITDHGEAKEITIV